MTLFGTNPFMPSTPFTDPLYFARPFIDAWVRGTEFPPPDPVPPGTPIAIEARVTDPGLTVSIGPRSLTISGTAAGGVEVGADTMTGTLFGTYYRSRGIAFSLDADRAPTVTRFGETNYREKNERSWYVAAAAGASAATIARRLARDVNARDDFRASVLLAGDGSATVAFTRR